MQQTWLGTAVPDHRLAVGQVTFSAAPGANRLGAFKKRVEFDGLAQDFQYGALTGTGAGIALGKALAAAILMIAACGAGIATKEGGKSAGGAIVGWPG